MKPSESDLDTILIQTIPKVTVIGIGFMADPNSYLPGSGLEQPNLILTIKIGHLLIS